MHMNRACPTIRCCALLCLLLLASCTQFVNENSFGASRGAAVIEQAVWRIPTGEGRLRGSSIKAKGYDVAEAPKIITADDIAQSIGKKEISVETTSDNFHVLFGAGGNIAVSIGTNGTLIVDDQYPQMIPKIMAAIAKLGGEQIDFAINTHWHTDHADGNQVLGPQGTWLVAQANSRKMMQEDNRINFVTHYFDQRAYPKEALPVITYNNKMQFHFNNEAIDLLHYGSAHTSGDTAVFFRKHNAVHMGDVYNNAEYPFIDADNGGTLEGVIHFCREVLKQSNRETTVIPGHGPIADYEALLDYVEMLETIRQRMVTLRASGATLNQVYDAQVTREWDKEKGDPTVFINRAYKSLK